MARQQPPATDLRSATSSNSALRLPLPVLLGGCIANGCSCTCSLLSVLGMNPPPIVTFTLAAPPRLLLSQPSAATASTGTDTTAAAAASSSLPALLLLRSSPAFKLLLVLD
jgi:hypothetical protein